MITGTVRWGILGTGSIASAIVVGLRTLPDTLVTAVGSHRIEGARVFSDRHNIPEAFGSIHELVNSPNVDVVYIATPNHVHRDHAIAALDAGKAVLCEKPMAMTAADAIEIESCARRNGVFCMEAMWTRFLPAMVELRDRVADGAIGDVSALSASFGYQFVFDPQVRLWDPAAGGGAILDLGPYLVALAVDVLGSVDDVVGLASYCETGVDDQVGFTLRHRGGGISTLWASISTTATNEALFSGSGGSIRVHEPLVRPERLTIKRSRPIEVGAAGSDGSTVGRLKRSRVVRGAARQLEPLRRRASRSYRTITIPIDGNGYQYQALEVNRCIRNGIVDSPIMPMKQTIEVLEVLDRLRKHAALGEPSGDVPGLPEARHV